MAGESGSRLTFHEDGGAAGRSQPKLAVRPAALFADPASSPAANAATPVAPTRTTMGTVERDRFIVAEYGPGAAGVQGRDQAHAPPGFSAYERGGD
jgi:hypothetical protein